MAIASSPLIWIKLRLVTGIPRMAYATEMAPSVIDPGQSMAASAEAAVDAAEALIARAE